MTPAAEQVQTFLDDLAVLTAAHSRVLDADVGGHMALDPLPAGSAPYGGYAVVLRGQEEGTHWWEVGVYEAGHPLNVCVASVDITSLSAHQPVTLRTALDRARAILRDES